MPLVRALSLRQGCGCAQLEKVRSALCGLGDLWVAEWRSRVGARERGLCLRGLKVSAILEKSALQRAFVFMRMQNKSDHVGVIECAS